MWAGCSNDSDGYESLFMLIMENVEHICRVGVIGCDISDISDMLFGTKMVILH